MHELAAAGTIDIDRPVVCVSAGNLGQGVAFASRALGLPCVVFASGLANQGKVAKMKAIVSVPVGNGSLINGIGAWMTASLSRLPGGGGTG